MVLCMLRMRPGLPAALLSNRRRKSASAKLRQSRCGSIALLNASGYSPPPRCHRSIALSTLLCGLVPQDRERGPHYRIGSCHYGAVLATTPMLAMSAFFIEGRAQTYRTTPLDGARASHTVLPNRSVT
jgi:hypothetical protein